MAPAAHAADWLSPVSFAGTAPASARTAIDNRGNVTAVWQDQTVGHCQVQAVDRASGVFSSVQTLSGTTPLVATDCQPDFASDPAGDAVAVWTNGTNAFASAKTAGGSWSAATPLDTTGVAFSDPKVAINDSGDATAVWVTTTHTILRTARWNGSNWTSAGNLAGLSAGHTYSSPAVGVDSAGDARAVWEDFDGVTATVQAAARTGNGATFGAPQSTPIQTGTLRRFEAIQVAPNSAGDWLALWRMHPTAGSEELDSSSATGAGDFGTTPELVPGSGHPQVDPPAIAFGPDGTGTIVFSYLDSGTYDVLVGAWTATSGVDPSYHIVAQGPATEFATPHSVAVDPLGAITIVYEDGGMVYTRHASTPSGLGQLAVPLGSGSAPSIGIGDGYLSALWPDGSNVDLRVFDAVPPSTPSISGPSSGNVGDVLGFSATASDDWGPVGIKWTFGDGTAPLAATGSGAPVTHAFGGPGVFTVTAEAVDGAGNKSSDATSLVTIKGSGGGGSSTPPASGLPAPVAGVSANLQLLSGNVLIKVPGSGAFVPLTGEMQLPVGTIVDARGGSLQITISDGLGHLLSGVSSGGQFVLQQKVPATSSRARGAVAAPTLATLLLYGGDFRSCKTKRPPGARSATAARKRKKKKNLTIRQLLTSGGAFQTQGKYAAAVVRGTQWVTADRCDGTLIKVRSGKVLVRDLVKKRSFLVRAHHQYLARPRRG